MGKELVLYEPDTDYVDKYLPTDEDIASSPRDVVTVKVPRRAFGRWQGKTTKAFVHKILETGKHVVVLSSGSNSRVRLHELGHVKLGHIRQGRLSWPEYVENELEAEAFANSKLGKSESLTYHDLANVALTLRRNGLTLSQTADMMKDACSSLGLDVPESTWTKVWKVLIYEEKSGGIK